MPEPPLDNATNTTAIRSDEPTSTGPETEYMILTKNASGTWIEHEKPVKARSAGGAVRALKAEGTYVAVPSRSWKPVTVKAEQRTVLTLEDAT